MLWGCFSAAGTERLIRAEEKLNAPKYRDSLNENPVQSIQHPRRAEGLLSNRTMNINKQTHNSVNVLEWPSHSLSLNPIKYFWRNLKICVCLIQPFLRRMTDDCQMLKRKAFHTKKDSRLLWCFSWVMNWILMQCSYFSFLFLINVQSCDSSVVALSL